MPSLFRRCITNPRLWQLALTCYWLALFIATHMPVERLALSRGSADKFAHVAAFAVLAILVATTWRLSTGRLRLRQLLSAWILVVLYGAIEETTQPMVNRSASLIDWFADAIGATLGLAIYWWGLEHWLNKAAPDLRVANVENGPRTWRRYSLKTLFVAMTLIALANYWMMLPTMNAQKFVRAMRQRDYAKAESLFVSWSDKFPGDFKKHDVFQTDPRIQPLTWNELWKGERRVLVTSSYGNKKGTTRCGATIFAYRRGLALHPLVLPLPKQLIKS